MKDMYHEREPMLWN